MMWLRWLGNGFSVITILFLLFVSPVTAATLQEAKDLFDQQQFEAARGKLEAIVKSDKKGKGIEARFYLGLTYYKLAQYEKAMEQFDWVAAKDPKYDSIDYNRGVTFLGLKKFPDAIKVLTRALEKEGEQAKIYYSLGLAYAQINDHPQVIAALTKAIQVNPALGVDAYYYLALAYFNSGKLGEAERLFTHVYQVERDTVYSQYAYQYLLAIEKYRAPSVTTQKQFKTFNLTLAPSYSYETNVTSAAAEVLGPSGTDDYKTQFFISTSWKPVLKREQPLTLGYSFYLNNLPNHVSSNTIGHIFNVTHVGYPGGNSLASKLSYSQYITKETGQTSYTSLAWDERYTKRLIPSLTDPAALSTLYLTFSSDVIPSSEGYKSLNYTLGYQQNLNKVYKLGYELKFSNTLSTELAFFYHDLGVTGTYDLPRLKDTTLEWSAKYNLKYYPNDKDASGGNSRNDNKLTAYVSIEKNFYEWSLKLKYTSTDNKSNFTSTDPSPTSYQSYHNNSTELSLTKAF